MHILNILIGMVRFVCHTDKLKFYLHNVWKMDRKQQQCRELYWCCMWLEGKKINGNAMKRIAVNEND